MSLILEKPNWNSLKSVIDSKGLLCQYDESDSWYYVFAFEGQVIYTCKVLKTDPRNADQIDFEDNHMGECNKPDRMLVAASDALFVPESFTTTVNTFVPARPVNGFFKVHRLHTKQLYIENVGSNSVDVRLVGNFGGGSENTIIIVGNQTLAAGQGASISEERPFEIIAVLVKPTLANLHSTVRTRGYALGT